MTIISLKFFKDSLLFEARLILKGIIYTEFCHCLLTHMPFQACMNTKMSVFFVLTMKVSGVQSCFGLHGLKSSGQKQKHSKYLLLCSTAGRKSCLFMPLKG